MKRIKRKRAKKRIIRHEQWIEIKRKEGKTVVSFYPTNEEFEKERLEMDPPPDFIYRRLNFVHGIPHEYRNIDASLRFRRFGGLFLQRVLPEEWPEIMESERRNGNTQVVPARRPQPRPAELGPCPCAKCRAERADPSRKSRYDYT